MRMMDRPVEQGRRRTQRADTGHEVPYDTVQSEVKPHAQVSAAAVHRVCCMQL